MFVVTEMKDCVRIPPIAFNKPLKSAITTELNSKLSNKVVMNVGLCIALWDITKLGNSHIIPSDGGHHTLVEFRFVVFRPFVSEVLTGKVKSCSRDGVSVTLGFFDDIFIPEAALQHPCRFDEAEQVWVWEYQTEDGSHDLFMDVGEPIRFRVTEERFEENSPGSDPGADRENSEQKTPYSLIATISEPGLGLKSWWSQSEAGEGSGGEEPEAGKMLNVLVAELSTIFEILEQCHILQNFTLSLSLLRPPSSAVGGVLLSLCAAIEDHRLRLQTLLTCQSPYNQEAAEPAARERPVKDEYFARTAVTLSQPDTSYSPECLEALNLSVAASPEYLEAINLSVAPSPCYPDEGTRLKNFQDVGSTSAFWEQVVNGPNDCFQDGHSVPNPSEGFMDFPADIDGTTPLEDNYILDITSNVNVNALNAAIYFEREGVELPQQGDQKFTDIPEFEPEAPKLVEADPLDLSHSGALDETCGICEERHANDDEHVYCDECGRAFHSGSALKRHILAHVSPLICEFCGTRCVDKRKLRRHMRTHMKATFRCTICRKTFSRSDSLQRHRDIVHHKARDFRCGFCPKKFSVKCNRDNHEQTIHLISLPVSCPVCERKYRNKATLRVHMNTHGPPRFVCEKCKKMYHRLPLYRRHMFNQHGFQIK